MSKTKFMSSKKLYVGNLQRTKNIKTDVSLPIARLTLHPKVNEPIKTEEKIDSFSDDDEFDITNTNIEEEKEVRHKEK